MKTKKVAKKNTIESRVKDVEDVLDIHTYHKFWEFQCGDEAGEKQSSTIKKLEEKLNEKIVRIQEYLDVKEIEIDGEKELKSRSIIRRIMTLFRN